MTKEEHKQRHIKLHENLDELIGDYISQTKKMLSKTTIMELIEWSHQQTIEPTEL